MEATTADTEDDVAEMDQMKIDLIEHSGTAKQGVIDLYKFAKENVFLINSPCDCRVHECNNDYIK